MIAPERFSRDDRGEAKDDPRKHEEASFHNVVTSETPRIFVREKRGDNKVTTIYRWWLWN
jgi:hypothetical protein